MKRSSPLSAETRNQWDRLTKIVESISARTDKFPLFGISNSVSVTSPLLLSPGGDYEAFGETGIQGHCCRSRRLSRRASRGQRRRDNCLVRVLSVEKYTVAVVPAGMFIAWMFTVRGELEFRVTSGTVKLPVGLGGTATPPMLVTIIEGCGAAWV